MSHEEFRSLDYLDDILIVQKIERKDPSTVTSRNDSIEATQCLCFESGCDCERNLLVEAQEAIIKKQLQMLQADERGKQALISEVAALKERQENRAELLRNRQHALDIEKERARKIASLPPPLPKSVKLLLKKSDNEPKLSRPDVQMPDELTAINIKPIESYRRYTENKENITDPEELESRQKMREERDMKAKKRYYEALKKDRQKEEYSKIMKQVQNAELLNRQEMAKNISSDKKGMPCPLSDKFQTAKKQVDMEDAAEKIFKKTGTKEHVIEDIEGYQDHYEEKYKKIHSNYESKMIDCIPSFVKENYDYLLEDESKFTGGKNFSGLDDSNSDILNDAFFETPPGTNKPHETGQIDHAISHLDRLRSDLETEYEQNVKPLLAAAVEIPKKELKDKAVETESVKKFAKDKAVETDEQFKNDLASPSPTAALNFTNAGVMAYKRRPRTPIFNTYEGMNLPDMHQRDVNYIMPLVSESKDPTESWSPSTYCSLPSKHGIPTFPNASKSMVCDICIAEMKKNQIKDNFIQESLPMSEVVNKEKSDNVTDSTGKNVLSKYVQQLVKKHLVMKSSKNSMQGESNVGSFNDLSNKTINPAFEKEIIGKSKVGIFSEPDKLKEFDSVPVKRVLPEEEKRFQFSPLVPENPLPVTETDIKKSDARKEMIKSEESQDDIYLKIKDNELHKSPSEYSDYDYEAKRIQAIHQVLSRQLPRFTIDDSDKCEEKENGKEAKQLTFPVQNEMIVRPHIYHELSTIQEADSALIASSLQLSQSKLSDTSGTKEEKKEPPKEKLKDLLQSAERLKMVSLLDPPDTEIAELANSIYFVPEAKENVNYSLEISETVYTNSSRDKSIFSKEHLSTPTLATGSYSSSLPLSSSTQSIPSSKSRENKDIQSCMMSGDIGDTEFKDVTQSKALQSKQDKKDTMHTIISGYMSDLDVQQVSTCNKSSLSEKKREMNSIISGYISDLEEPQMSASDTHPLGQDRKDTMHSIISGYISDLDVQKMTGSDISDLGQEENNIQPVISKYISDFEMAKTDISHFYQGNKGDMHSFKSQFIKNINIPHENDYPKFLPMTPHSDISSPNTYNDTVYSALKSDDIRKIPIDKDILLKRGQSLTQTSSSEKSFKPMTLHSNISSPSESSNTAFKNDLQNDSKAGKPMTPHSNVSSPSDFASHAVKKDLKNENIIRNLKPMPLQSNVSSPSKSTNLAFKKDTYDGNSIEIFKALTPYSNISSPSSDIIFSLNDEHKGFTSSPGFFLPLTPHSNISSPASDTILPFENVPIGDASSSRRLDKISSKNTEMKPVLLRFDILTDSLKLSSTKNKPSEAKHISQFNCNLSLKTHLLEPTNYSLTPQVPGSEITTRAVDNRKYGARYKNKVQKRHKGLFLTAAKQYALACSSDFFVPSMNEDSASSNENINKSLKVSTENSDDINKLEAVFDPQMAIASNIKKNVENLAEENKSGSGSATSDKEVSNKIAEEEVLGMKSKGTCKTQVQLENRRNLLKQKSNLQSLSSASSSTESLSVISRSKVVCQSTPIKNMSEILQEPGILEEPDLTLFATRLSCKMDTTEMNKGPLISILPEKSEHQEKTCKAGFSQDECITPTFLSPQLSGSADTPSMRSFLQHEMSCWKAESNSVQSPASEVHFRRNLRENKTPVLREVKRSLFKRAGYKERTKRLWNNLEEVKKKNLAEERKKEMEINRRKAKEFAKNLTPKQRRK